MAIKGARRSQKTEAQRQIDGSRVRPGHHKQPTPVEGEPACPSWLDAQERAWWEELAALLRGQRRLTVDTAPWLLSAASAMVDFLKWRATAAASPMLQTKVLVDGAGVEHREEKPHPAHQQYRLARTALLKTLVEAGLTPTSISRVVMPAQDEAIDDFDAHAAKAQIRRVK